MSTQTLAPNQSLAVRLPMPANFEENHGMAMAQWSVLVDAIFPSAESTAAVVLALNYCKARNLDVFKKPVHIVPMWSSRLKRNVETVWPGIAELRITAMRTERYAGKDATVFGPDVTEEFSGPAQKWENGQKVEYTDTFTITYPEWAELTVYKIVGGMRCAFVGPKVYWKEAFATQGKSDLPNEMWRTRTRGQLDKCAEAASIRAAFPEETGNILTAEEMAGKTINVAEPEPAPIKHSASKSKSTPTPASPEGTVKPSAAESVPPAPAASKPSGAQASSPKPDHTPASSPASTQPGQTAAPSEKKERTVIVGVVERSNETYQDPAKGPDGKYLKPAKKYAVWKLVCGAEMIEASSWDSPLTDEIQKAMDASLPCEVTLIPTKRAGREKVTGAKAQEPGPAPEADGGDPEAA